MHVLLLVPRTARAWHSALAEELRAAGVATTVRTTGAPSWGRDLDRLVRRERRLHRLPAGGSDPSPPGRLASGADADPRPHLTVDLTLDLTGHRPFEWAVTFDGRPGEPAAADAVLAGRFPVVRVVDGHGRTLTEGRPGSELPGLAAAALDGVLAGTVRLVVTAVTGHRSVLPDDPDPDDPDPAPARTAGARARRAVVGAAARRAYRSLYRSPHWRVGWRLVDGAGVLESGRLPDGGWRDLPDDGRHFYADPFPIVVAGERHLFVEDFDHRRGRGVISVVEVGDAGPIGPPRPVLEHDVHLSYPCVFEDDGEVWMVPESSAAGTVELYRATRFPDRWTLEQVLLRDVDASDATPFRHDGRWWLSATVRQGGSCSDALHLWYADALTGPWKPHERNPVLVDIASARPAGRPGWSEGRLLRPVQDGRDGYGAALAVAEVVDLDPSTFTQRVVARLSPGAAWPGSRLHTLNRAGDLEVVDGSARSSRLRRGSRR